jgi:hypothetical protein
MKKQVLSLLAIATFAISASAQITNAGFETWSTSTGEDQQPTGWVSYNVFTSPLIDPSNMNPTSVTQAPSPNNYLGTYSAKITTVDLVINPASPSLPNRAGILMAGTVNLSSPYIFPGYIFANRPATFSYAAKYTPTNVDSANAVVIITKWNTSTGSRDTIAVGYDNIPATIPAYLVRNVNLVYDPAFNNVMPDTAQILFSASSFITPQAGSQLWVDALSFTGYVGMDEATLNNRVEVYPNPSSTMTTFDVVAEEAYQVVVTDMTGREVNRLMINNKSAKLNSYQMAAGVYTYTVITKENEVMNRGKFSVAQ